ncbi:MAG: GNAT family N-acetyltransferase [Eubacterium sp.]|nr:GNAT family N-acetyltransferase [Eubacterium sp.]MCM1213856.1 GNAT family N-acetyltransferase [Lachnospiraceae bacterium]MCM1240117.1 GNAT family N-acetyltransferase [Lachnospiraceae bacterium]
MIKSPADWCKQEDGTFFMPGKGDGKQLYYYKEYRLDIDGKEYTFVITDCGEGARKLRAAGVPVAVYLHPGNKDQDLSDFLYAVEDPEDIDTDYMKKACRRLLGLPWDILETARCLIRETTVEDVDGFYEIYRHPAITEFMEDLYPEKEQEREYIRQYIEQVYTFWEFGVWTVVEKDNGAVIGRAGFSYREGFEEPELGFIIGVPWQRRGYAEEVCRAILDYGRDVLGFGTVQAFARPENIASMNLCDKLGFHAAGTEMIEGKEHYRYRKDL